MFVIVSLESASYRICKYSSSYTRLTPILPQLSPRNPKLRNVYSSCNRCSVVLHCTEKTLYKSWIFFENILLYSISRHPNSLPHHTSPCVHHDLIDCMKWKGTGLGNLEYDEVIRNFIVIGQLVNEFGTQNSDFTGLPFFKRKKHRLKVARHR
jgi:hypothetical protein